MSDSDHWRAVYQSKQPDQVSWFAPHLDLDLALIKRAGLDPSAHIVDVGAGAATLIDDLLGAGFTRLTALDLSEDALAASQARLGSRAEQVRWIVGDATLPLLEDASVDLWHDRAVLHFLTDVTARDAYIARLHAALNHGSWALLATFAPDGPTRCSGLDVSRYTPQELAALLGPRFTLVEQALHTHTTPWGAPQRFAYALCQHTP